VEFRSGSPNELILWKREGFSQDEALYSWAEALVTPRGEVVSPGCQASPQAQTGLPARTPLEGILWDLGAELPMIVHEPWKSHVLQTSKNWKLSCGFHLLAQGLRPTFPETDDSPEKFDKSPAVSLGVPILTRGPVIFDLPHGKIWIGKSAFDKPLPQDRSGLKVEYDFHRGDRVLAVRDIAPQSPAALLIQAGLKKGTLISQIDGKDADDIDHWEVQQRLAGAFGETVSISWNTPKGIKIVPIRVAGDK
jgi:hypothetical protein